MTEPTLPPDLVEARRTPLFDFSTLPTPLAESHRTTVWAELVVQAGSVRYVDLDGAADRDLGLGPGDTAVIEPGVDTSRTFDRRVVLHPVLPQARSAARARCRCSSRGGAPSVRAVGAARHRSRHPRRDLRDGHPAVRRHRAGPAPRALLHGESQSHRLAGPHRNGDRLLVPRTAVCTGYDIDVIEAHRPIHDRDPFSPEVFDRWLETFFDTVDGGWVGPQAGRAKKRATGMAWSMAERLLGTGVWRPRHHRTEGDTP